MLNHHLGIWKINSKHLGQANPMIDVQRNPTKGRKNGKIANLSSVTVGETLKSCWSMSLPKNGASINGIWIHKSQGIFSTLRSFSSAKNSPESWSFLRSERFGVLSVLDVWRKFENTKTTLISFQLKIPSTWDIDSIDITFQSQNPWGRFNRSALRRL